jgi:hypothetical protein
MYSDGSFSGPNGGRFRKDSIMTRTSATLRDELATVGGNGELPFQMLLELVIDDRDVIRSLIEFPEGEERNRYAIEAMKIGMLALRHVGGQFNADRIQQESERLVKQMQETLDGNMRLMHSRLADALKDYFDPESGRFNDRVRRLCSQDGELSQIMKGFLDGENSQLARTMITQIGPLMKHLDPRQSEGLLAVLRGSMESQLTQHRDHVLKEFSLDHKEGALSRLVNELTAKHGDLSKDLQKKIDEVVKEFSLNEEGSALKRLVDSVDKAQKRICDEFSLDNEQSALKRFRTELMTVFQAHVDVSAKFQEEVKLALRELTARREEQSRSTLHGGTFQSAMFEFLQRDSQSRGDIADFTGDRVGAIKNCKVGDATLVLGPDSGAPGATVVFEAKEELGYTLKRALEEIDTACKNRSAQVGVFIFSNRTAPDNLRSFARYGNHLIVRWDAEDPLCDPFLWAAVEFARLMCLRSCRQQDARTADFDAIDKAVNDIEKHAEQLDQVRTCAETIQTASNKILKRIEIDRETIKRQVLSLRERMMDLRNAASSSQ